MKKLALNLLVAVVGSLMLFGILVYWYNRNQPGSTQNPPGNSSGQQQGSNTTGLPIKLPDGFGIEIFAKNLPGARVLAQDSLGNFWVSRTSKGIVTLLEVKDGKVVSQSDVFKNLKNPHGLAFDPQQGTMLYIAEENKISRVAVYTEDSLHKIADLPSGGGHYTRTIKFGPDGKLYVSIGSSCNVCIESDSRRASIFSLNKDGSGFSQFAKGLRNTVFFTWSYIDGKMWGTDMGRDNLGDNLPPDEINLLQDSKNYGWPVCYGNNIRDTQFDKNTYIRNPCMEPLEIPPKVEIPAHSAPLGIAFVPEEGWPQDFWGNLIVAYHGSWNRSVPTGYKLVRVKLDSSGNSAGIEDFATGWLSGGKILGRPVDVLVQPGGNMYVTDDKAGVIYRIYRTSQQ